ncbi:TonB-dependent receptor [Peristeroidobacter soli]|uniref:TonB-dependent receptor n=1 Tax=Peristeroidobacter soli TaxID=2497877 RepID=UPI00101CCBF6|nr:TonB-dependent receptor [Peristeroidobacter soli]
MTAITSGRALSSPRRYLSASAIALLPGLWVGGVMAQTETASEQDVATGGLEQVIVTAQRREQNLQDVPIAVTAVTGAMVEARGIRTTDDLNVAIPGLNVSRSISTGLLYLRGVGNNSTNPGQEPNVGFYVDGVYYATMVSDLSSFNNVDHIEVLKGPQGTLFGRNTTGGLLQVVTRDPSHDLSGKASVGYGNYDTTSASAYVTGGFSDTLAADFSVNYNDQGEGWGRDTFRNVDVNFRDDLNLRTKWLWEPSEAWRITATADYNKIKSDLGSARQMLPGLPTTPAALGSISFNGNIYDSQTNSPVIDEIEGGGVALRTEYDNGGLRFVNIAAARKLSRLTLLDLDTTPGNRSSARYDKQEAETFSEEFQVLSPADSTIQWIAGLYYFHADDGVHPLQINNVALGAALYQQIDVSLLTDSYSAFAQATFPLGDRTSLTLGARYTLDQKKVEGTVRTALALLSTVDTDEDFDEPTFRAALDYKLTDDILAYVSVNTGFKSGLFNATTPTQPAVSPEKIIAYETGLKSELFDHSMRLNVAAFYYDYTDLQLTRFTGTATQLQNAADAEVYGLEVEMEASIGSGWTLMAGASALKSEYVKFDNAVSFVTNPVTGLGAQTILDVSGNNLQRTPEFTFNAAVDYRQPLAAGELGFNVGYYFNDGLYFEPDNQLRQPSYSLVNAEVSWSAPNDAYRVRLWAKNLLDEEYYNQMQTANNQPPIGAPGAPRTYGVSLSVNF